MTAEATNDRVMESAGTLTLRRHTPGLYSALPFGRPAGELWQCPMMFFLSWHCTRGGLQLACLQNEDGRRRETIYLFDRYSEDSSEKVALGFLPAERERRGNGDANAKKSCLPMLPRFAMRSAAPTEIDRELPK